MLDRRRCYVCGGKKGDWRERYGKAYTISLDSLETKQPVIRYQVTISKCGRCEKETCSYHLNQFGICGACVTKMYETGELS